MLVERVAFGRLSPSILVYYYNAITPSSVCAKVVLKRTKLLIGTCPASEHVLMYTTRVANRISFLIKLL